MKQNRAEFWPKVGGAWEKVIESMLGIFDLFVVGDEAAGFDGEDEVRGRSIAPGIEGFAVGKR